MTDITNNNDYSEENLMKALQIINGYCNNRNHRCEDCMLSNATDECLIYEYPYLWTINQRTVTRLLSDKKN